MDGTIIDSTNAIIKHWHQIGREIGCDPEVILATSHGRRSIDVLAILSPERANWECTLQIPFRLFLFSFSFSSWIHTIVSICTAHFRCLTICLLPRRSCWSVGRSVVGQFPTHTRYMFQTQKAKKRNRGWSCWSVYSVGRPTRSFGINQITDY